MKPSGLSDGVLVLRIDVWQAQPTLSRLPFPHSSINTIRVYQ